jgi:L-lactate dehydrogenase complex protein LldG
MSAREEILARIRTALGPSPTMPVEIPRGYRVTDDRPAAELLDVLVDRLEDYRATVLRCQSDAIGRTVAAALDTGLGAGWVAGDVVVAPGLPAAWRPEGVREDDDSPPVALAQAAAAVTGVADAARCRCCPTAWSASWKRRRWSGECPRAWPGWIRSRR